MNNELPLLNHATDAPSAFTPESLVAAVRAQRGVPAEPVPEVCVLEFDGDLTDRLVAEGAARRYPAWPCFHTPMFGLEIDGIECGIIPRTIGGPYAVLIAEQLAACGVRAVVALTSAGRVSADLPIPAIVVADRAIRDEGTSYHYLPPAEHVAAPADLADALVAEVGSVGLPVHRGLVWTTDAPYRETRRQLSHHAAAGALAVEMQAASLLAFSSARGVPVGVVAHVTNAVDHTGKPFDKGPADADRRILDAACRGAHRFLRTIPDS